MKVATPNERPSAESAEAPPRAATDERLPFALQELHRALHSMTIYPAGHPAIEQTIERAFSELSSALRGRGSTLVGVAHDHLLVDRVPIEDGPSALGSLAQFLHALDVAVVELRSSLTAPELERFLVRLGEARRTGRGGTALARALAEDRLESIRIFPLDYWALSFSTFSDPESRSGDSTEVWDGLVVNLAELARSRPGADPEALAEEANQRFVRDEGVGSGALREQMRALGQSLPGMDAWQREALRGRMSRFVGALNANLRQDLLRVDPQDGEDWIGVMAELSDTLPDAALLDVLRDINRAGHRVHDQFLNFMNKMARIPTEKSDTAVDLDTVLRRWRVAGTLDEDPRAFRSALREVLSRRRTIECNPEPYQEMLDDLTHRELSPATFALTGRYRNPADAADVRCQAVELAVHLLQDGSSGEHAPGILAHVGAATDELLDAGRFQPVRDAAVVARSICARDGWSDETRRAALGYLREFTAEARIEHILDHAVQGGSVAAAVEPLLALGGVAALQKIIDRLDGNPEPALGGVLQNVAVALGRGPMAQALDSRSGGGWNRLRPAFSVVRLFPPADATALLEPFSSHADPRVRREALVALCELDTVPEAPERYLRAALCDRESWIVTTAIDRLAARGSEESLGILGSFLEGSVVRLDAVLPHARRVCRALLERGDSGRARLAACLDAHWRSLRPRRVRIGRAIRVELAACGEEPQISAALSRWDRSPAGWMSRLLSGSASPEERA
jgi:hypothetical protein